jgi:hypothetical protein
MIKRQTQQQTGTKYFPVSSLDKHSSKIEQSGGKDAQQYLQ